VTRGGRTENWLICPCSQYVTESRPSGYGS